MKVKPTYEALEKRVQELEKEAADHTLIKEALKNAEERNNSLFELSPYGILTANLLGFITSCNKSFLSLSGYDRDQIVGKHYTRLPTLLKQDRNTYLSIFKTVIGGKTLEPFEFKWHRSDHSIRNAEGYIGPLKVGNKITGIQILVQDITDRKQAEEAVRESEQKYRLLADNVNDMIWMMDINQQRLTYVSPSVRKMRGYSMEEVMEQSLEEILTPESYQKAMRILSDELAGDDELDPDRSVTLDLEQYRKDGTAIWTEIIASIVRNDEKQPIAILGVTRDITERKQTEDALRENEDRLSKINECFINFTTDPFENINRVTSVCGEIFGATCALYNRLDQGLLYSWGQWNTPSDYNPVDKPDGHICYDVIKNASDKVFVVSKLQETHYAQTDPNVVPFKLQTYVGKAVKFFDTFIGSLCVVFQDDFVPNEVDKKILEILASAIAVEEERKRAEEALQQKMREMETFINNIPHMAWLKDSDSNFILANRAFGNAVGMDPEYLKSHTCAVCFGEDEANKSKEDDRRVMENKKQITFEETIIDKNGNIIYLETTKAPIFSDTGDISGTVGISIDLTEKKLLQNKLQQAQKMESLGTLAGGIAHEINNILGIIIGNAELAIDDIPEWNPAKDFLEEIFTASLRAKDVVQQIMSFARKTPATREPVRIGTVVKEGLKLIRVTIPTSIEIRKEIQCDAEVVIANPTEINQILVNLCNNSVDAIKKETGILEVRLETIVLNNRSAIQYQDLKAGKYSKLTVKDNGEGIAPEIMDRIFDPYFTTKDVDEGLGMGLAVVYGIVKKHDGAISVKSDAGKRTTAEVLFPITEIQPEIEKKEVSGLSMGKERILFVDDEASLVKTVKQMLERQGYEVVGKTSSREALKLFQKEPDKFDLIITDMAMPEMPGDRLAREILKIHASIPIMLCTGHSERIDEEKAEKLGITAYIMKPLERNDLVKTVRRVLDTTKGTT